jgi:LmbE family N-acetylglucosaminyl deacetylase
MVGNAVGANSGGRVGSEARRARLLGVFAHPDDETFCAGGTFARYAKDGAEIMVASATRGQAGQIRDARVGTRRTIAAVREAELRLACERLGVAHVQCWDYLDGALADADFAGLVGHVVGLIREFRPQLVITFGPDGGYGHPDHITISAAVTAACRQAGDPARYADQLAAGLAPHRPDRLYHSYFPPQDMLLMDRLARWLTSQSRWFTGTMDFVHALLLMAEEAGTMGFIRDHARVYWYPAGCYVVEQGEAASELFLILSGHADAWQELPDGSRKELRRMGPGEFFGELGVADNQPRSAHVVAVEGLTCLVLSPEPPSLYAGRGEGARLQGALPGRRAVAAPAGLADAGLTDAGPANAGAADARGADAGAADAGLADAGLADAGLADAGLADAGPAGDGLATACLDVTGHIEAKVGALCAYRSQFPLEQGMFPDFLLKELFGREYFIQVLPPRQAETELL